MLLTECVLDTGHCQALSLLDLIYSLQTTQSG